MESDLSHSETRVPSLITSGQTNRMSTFFFFFAWSDARDCHAAGLDAAWGEQADPDPREKQKQGAVNADDARRWS